MINLISTFIELYLSNINCSGEYEFSDIFGPAEESDPDSANDIPTPTIAFVVILLLIFMAMMTIVLMNMLIGLAVNNISEIQKDAESEKLMSQVLNFLIKYEPREYSYW